MPPILKDFLSAPGSVEVIGPLKASVVSLIASVDKNQITSNAIDEHERLVGKVQSFDNNANGKIVGATSVLNKLLASHVAKSEKVSNPQMRAKF